MVRFSRVWRAVLRMGHPQVRWSVWLMTQHGGMPAQLQGEGEGVEALPLNWVECGFFHLPPTLLRSHTVFPGRVTAPARVSRRQTAPIVWRSRPTQAKTWRTPRASSGTPAYRAGPPPAYFATARYPYGAPLSTCTTPARAACRVPRRWRSMRLARAYAAISPCTC